MLLQYFFLPVIVIVLGQDAPCVDDEGAALSMIMPIVETGALRFFGTDSNCVLAIAAIPGLCDSLTNPCCARCEEYANADWDADVMKNKRFLQIDSFFGSTLPITDLAAMEEYIAGPATMFLSDSHTWTRGGVGTFTGAREIVELLQIDTLWFYPESHFDLAAGPCDTSPYWPSSIYDEISELTLIYRSPTFAVSAPTGPTGDPEYHCVELEFTYTYTTKDDINWIAAAAWPMDESDAQRRLIARDEMSVEDLCTSIMANCLDDNQQYDDYQDCVDYHNQLSSYKDLDPELGCMALHGHTTTCHSFWMLYPEYGIRPEHYCPRAGKLVPDDNGYTWCDFANCDPSNYIRTCVEAVRKGEGMAALQWTQEGVDYDGPQAHKVHDIRGSSLAGDLLTQRQNRRLENYMELAVESKIVECRYYWGEQYMEPGRTYPF